MWKKYAKDIPFGLQRDIDSSTERIANNNLAVVVYIYQYKIGVDVFRSGTTTSATVYRPQEKR